MPKRDDSDEESTAIAVPIELPISSKVVKPTIAKIIEDENIATSDDDDDDQKDGEVAALSVSSNIESDIESDEKGDMTINYDFTVDTKEIKIHEVLNKFPSKYDNIIAEFADVEIFLISLDGLLIELTSHWYLNWELGGQTIVIAKQIDKFLNQLSHLGGKFKLIWMTDLIPHYSQDTILNFVRSFIDAHLKQSKWVDYIEYFSNPYDPRWSIYLHQLTPSFLMMSVADVSKRVTDKELRFGSLLAIMAINTLANAIPIVHLNGLVINLCSVYCHRVEALKIDFKGWPEYMKLVWNQSSQSIERNVNLSQINNTAELWANVIAECKKKQNLGNKFDRLASAVLIASLIGIRRGLDRIYLEEREAPKRGVDHITHRRALLNQCSQLLNSIDFAGHPLKFELNDLWDGRLIMCIYNEIESSQKISPYRIQSDLAPLHKMANLECSLEVDMDDRLFDAKQEKRRLIDDMRLLPISSDILHKYAREWMEIVNKNSTAKENKIFELFNDVAKWPFHKIEEEYASPTDKSEDDFRTKKRLDKQRQLLYRWFEIFAQSLEGRGSDLLVDFSRTPRGFAAPEEVMNGTKKKEKQHWEQKGKGGGGKAKKGTGPSKKELILETNKNKKSEKLVETEKQMVHFATMQGKNAIALLENLMFKLELDESRSQCIYEQMIRIAKELSALEGASFLEQRRIKAVILVDKIKNLLTVHWNYLNEQQKNVVNDLLVQLGFDTNKKRPTNDQNRLSLNMNLIYYQLVYGGEIIDILCDPQRDSRVTGFRPDAWQREMLSAVDRNYSAVIIAPTSAGKTFVSYYCIERVLRQSDDDMVVYVSPSKALLNQVCGSVYARFRNKSLSGGKSLFGTLTHEFASNPLNCQVLITVPECLEELLVSCNPTVQAVVNKIKYVIFDEVHSISASPEAHIWEHLLLLIRCPFLALSATIGNAEVLHEWLKCAEQSKALKGQTIRKVELIRYGERYSELELCMQRIDEDDFDETLKENGHENGSKSVLQHFMPYGVYKPVKLSMFGIPDDQQLTARQIFDLYNALAEVDEKVKEELEPCKFFNYHEGGKPVWLTRADLRRLENALKTRFLEWLKTEPKKMNSVLDKLGCNVQQQLDYRSRPFDQRSTALKSIVPLIMELRDKEMLPAICFNDDRKVCEQLADKLFEYLEAEQHEFEESDEFKSKYAIKDEEKMMKLTKRKRDVKEKAKVTKKKGGEKDRDEERDNRETPQDTNEEDPLAAKKLRLNQILERFKLRSQQRDEDLFTKMTDRLNRGSGRFRDSTRLLLKLFERGIGFHHEGLNAAERIAVEILFRSGQLAMIFSTSTLALGMNMPCKSVIFGVDHPLLTPLQFRQMSGRAGRRGYDRSGTVIFMSIPTSKIRRLLTASLSTLRGNVPFTASFILRLFSYVHQKTDAKDALQYTSTKAALSLFDVRVKTALTLLENSFALFTRSEMRDALQKQIKLFTLFSVQLLRSLELLNEKGEPKGMASIVCHLSAHEPGNLLFIHLLQNGKFHAFCKQYSTDRNKLKSLLIVVFANLFTNRRLPLGWNPDDKDSYPSGGDSRVFLESMPELFTKSVEEYNERVESLFRAFMQLGSKNGSLQGSCFSLTGTEDTSLSIFSTDIVRPLHDGFIFDETLVPARPVTRHDHRENKIWFNAYAVDFWRLESKRSLEANNNIADRETWHLIHDFSVTLDKISEALSKVGRSKDPFVEIMKELSEEYDKKFRGAFGMKQKY